jgi:hypothetical protein
VARNVVSEAFSLDHGVARTALDLTLKPARVIDDYLRGRTEPYSPPIRYFLIWLTVAQLLSLWSGALEGFVAGLTDTSEANDHRRDLTSQLLRFYVVGSAAIVPLLAVWTRVLAWRGRRNLAE